MEKNVTAVFDACVLYPARLKDLLMELSGLAYTSGLFKAKWTEKIHEEWISNLLDDRKDITREKLERTRDLMNKVVPECVVTGYEHRIDALELPDPDDRHVLAAAIECGAEIIVTSNMKDFPDQLLKQSSVIAKHPDDFLCEFLEDFEELGERLVEKSLRNMKARLKNPPRSWEEIFESLEKCALPRFVEKLRKIIPEVEVKEDAKKSPSEAVIPTQK